MELWTMPLDAGHRMREKQREQEMAAAREAAIRLCEAIREQQKSRGEVVISPAS